MHSRLILAILFSLPGATQAEELCKFSDPRALELNLKDVKTILLEVNANDLSIEGEPEHTGKLSGRACAASPELLKNLVITQKRAGDKLVITLGDSHPIGPSFGESYAYLDLRGKLPNGLPVELDVGSGEAKVRGIDLLNIDLGSGEVRARQTKGKVTAKIDAGELTLEDIGSLHVLAIGSGDLHAERVSGPVEIGPVDSGEAKLKHIAGNVKIGPIDSGEVKIQEVHGSVAVESIDSGNLEARKVSGDFSVTHHGSGDIAYSQIGGAVRIRSDR